MSWVSENKFLTGFGGVILVSIGALGYLTWSAMGKYETAVGEFDSAVTALRNTESSKPSPSDANFKELAAQKQEIGDKIDALHKDLKSRVLVTQPLTKEQFQDKLKDAVAGISAKAIERNVTLGEKQDKFYMGYAKYQSAPPDDSAAPALGRQLRAIELIMGVLINDCGGGIELKELKREELPEERGTKRAKPSNQGSKNKKGGKDADADSSGQHLVEKSTVSVKFLGQDKALRQFLNAIASHPQQFFIIRSVNVQNERTESPPKLSAATAPPTPTPAEDAAKPAEATPAPGAATPAPTAPLPADAAPAAPQGSLQYAFGTEKVEATVDIEILDFAEPEARLEKASKGKGK